MSDALAQRRIFLALVAVLAVGSVGAAWVASTRISFGSDEAVGIGCRVTMNGVVPLLGSFGSNCRLEAYDAIEHVDVGERRITRDFHTLRVPVGQDVGLKLRRGKTTHELTLAAVSGIDRGDLAGYFVVGGFLSLVGLAVSLSVLFNSRGYTAFACVGLAASLSICGVSLLSGAESAFLNILSILGLSLIPAATWHLALVFPKPTTLVSQVPRVLPSLYLLCAILGVTEASAAYINSDGRLLKLVELIHVGLFLCGASYLAWRCLEEIRSPTSELRLAQARALIVGVAAIAAAPACLYRVADWVGLGGAELATLALMLAPAPLAMVTTRSAFLDVGVQARRFVTQGAQALVLSGGVVLMLSLAHAALAAPISVTTLALTWVVSSVTFLAAGILLRSSDAGSSSWRSAELRRKLVSARGEAAVGEFLSTSLSEIADPTVLGGFIQLRDEPMRALEGLKGADFTRCEAEAALDILSLEDGRAVVVIGEGSAGCAASLVLERAGVMLVARLSATRHRIALLLLGPPRGWLGFTSVHLEALESLVAQASIALEHCWLVADAQSDSFFTARGQLASEIAHDLKNPLQSIARIARREGHSQIAAIAREGQEIVDGLLAKTSTENEPIDGVIAEAISTLGNRGDADRVFLRLAPDLPAMSGALALKRVVRNLVNNAIDASPAAELVEVVGVRLDDRTVIEVIDSGCGMTESDCARAFQPLWTTKHNGTGLGLASSQAIVSRLGGSIALKSEVGVGTRVRIELPSHLYEDSADSVQHRIPRV